MLTRVVLYVFMISVVHGLGDIKQDCPGDLIYTYDASSCVPMCGDPFFDAGFDFRDCVGPLYGACRCPSDQYLMDDGISCVDLDNCPAGSARICPANQILAYPQDNQYTCFDQVFIGDVFFEYCTCPEGQTVDIDGLTCIDRSECPPKCPGNQILNTVDGKPCTKTCEFRNPPCDTFAAKRCECPDEAPFLSDDGVSCLTAAECDAGTVTPTPPPPVEQANTVCNGASSNTLGSGLMLNVSITNGPNDGNNADAALPNSASPLELTASDRLSIVSNCPLDPLPFFHSVGLEVKGANFVEVLAYEAGTDFVMNEGDPNYAASVSNPNVFNKVLIPNALDTEIPFVDRIELVFSASANAAIEVRNVHAMWCCGTDLNIGICPGNQQWRLTYILTTPNPPIATCEPTCDNPQQDRDEFCLRTATPAWKCACPENKPILSDDGVTCIEEKFCPLKSCYGNQQWVSTGKPCDLTCNVDQSAAQCSNFDALRCECPASMPFLDASDGITCISSCSLLTPPPPPPPTTTTTTTSTTTTATSTTTTSNTVQCDANSALTQLTYGSTQFDVRLAPSTNQDATQALRGSGRSLAIPQGSNYKIKPKSLSTATIMKTCMKVKNTKSVKFSFVKGGVVLRETVTINAGNAFRRICFDTMVVAKRLDLNFNALDSSKDVMIKNVVMTACFPNAN